MSDCFFGPEHNDWIEFGGGNEDYDHHFKIASSSHPLIDDRFRLFL